jgi:hypothetical protein
VVTWSARVRNADLTLRDPITFTSATLVENYNSANMFQVAGRISDLREALDTTRGVVVWDEANTQRFCGFCSDVERRWDGTATITYTGDLAKLGWRICWPTPANAWTAQNVDAYDHRTAVAETRALQYINFNAGPSARTERRIPKLRVLASGGRGPSGKTSARFQYVNELAATLAELADLRLRITQTFADVGGPYLDVDMVAAPDLSTSARYGSWNESRPGLLGDESRYKIAHPSATVILAAAGGEGTARTMSSYDQSANALNTPWSNPRVEKFLDQRGSDAAQVAEAAQTEIDQSKSTIEVAAALTNSDLVIGSDVPLGAKVAATLDGQRIVERVRQITTEVSVAGDAPTFRSSAVFGTPDTVPLPFTVRQVRDALRSVRLMERI